MARYRKRPVVIEATQILDEQTAKGILGICTGGPDCKLAPNQPDAWPHIHTLEGSFVWTPGDWLITGVAGERYFCKPDIFEKTYEPV